MGLINTTPRIAEYGKFCNRSGQGLTENTDWCYTEYYDLEYSGTQYICDNNTNTDHTFQYQTNIEGTKWNYWYGPRRSVPAHNVIRFSIRINSIDDAYAYSEKTGQIFFAGKNSLYYGYANINDMVSNDTASLIERRRQILLNTPHLASASANPLTFQTDVSANLKDCKIYFEPIQEGSGDPSPDNVRPISGWDGVELHINNTSLTIPFPQTIYGGYVDLVKGEVVETWQKVVLDGDETPNAGSNYNGSLGTNRYFTIPSTGLGYNVGSGYCETAKFQRGAIWASPDSHLGEFNINTAQLHVVFTNATVGITSEMTVNEKTAAIKTWLASNPMTFVVPLATPITYQLTPETIRTLRGVNNVWSNANGNIEIDYWGH